MLAFSRELGIATDPTGRPRCPDGTWQPALAAGDGRSHPISNEFRPLAGPAFDLGISAAPRSLRARPPAWRTRARAVRREVAAAAGPRALARARRAGAAWPAQPEAAGHRARASTRASSTSSTSAPSWCRDRVPLANEGWQSFQAPLFYLVAAPPYGDRASRLGGGGDARDARAVLACALGLVEMVYRAARAAFPERDGSPDDRHRHGRLPAHDGLHVALREQRATRGAADGGAGGRGAAPARAHRVRGSVAGALASACSSALHCLRR